MECLSLLPPHKTLAEVYDENKTNSKVHGFLWADDLYAFIDGGVVHEDEGGRFIKAFNLSRQRICDIRFQSRVYPVTMQVKPEIHKEKP